MTLTPLWRYVLVVVALIPATFTAWVYFDPWLTSPIKLLAASLIETVHGSVVESIRFEREVFWVLSRYGEAGGSLVPAETAGNQIAVQVNTRLVTYALPFYAALYFAMRGAGVGNFILGLLVLWGSATLGLYLMALKSLATALPPAQIYGDAAWVRDACLVGYQFSVLLAPTLIPVMLVAVQSPAAYRRSFFNRPFGQ